MLVHVGREQRHCALLAAMETCVRLRERRTFLIHREILVDDIYFKLEIRINQ